MATAPVQVPVIELFPPRPGPNGTMTYTATIYGSNNQRLNLSATVSAPLRAKLASTAARAMAWAKGHVRLPEGPLRDLMSGAAPDCGCDTVGETFRSLALRAADMGSELGDRWSEDGALAFGFDDWTGAEEHLWPDVEDTMADVMLGLYGDAGHTGELDAMGAIRPRLTAKGAAVPQPGIAMLKKAMAGVLGLAA